MKLHWCRQAHWGSLSLRLKLWWASICTNVSKSQPISWKTHGLIATWISIVRAYLEARSSVCVPYPQCRFVPPALMRPLGMAPLISRLSLAAFESQGLRLAHVVRTDWHHHQYYIIILMLSYLFTGKALYTLTVQNIRNSFSSLFSAIIPACHQDMTF